MQFEKHPAKTVICRQGEPADSLFVIVQGYCTVSLRREAHEESERRVSVLGPLTVFGENALVDVDAVDGGETKRVRNATVTVESNVTQLLKLTRGTFDELVASGVLAGARVAAEARKIKRQRDAHNRRLETGTATPGVPL